MTRFVAYLKTQRQDAGLALFGLGCVGCWLWFVGRLAGRW